ncbi:cation diffusion facilitator family transporter [Flavobacteriales bacterium]|nr:cation diffusion facilitator family transporter [Flavobacteriales bacterium]
MGSHHNHSHSVPNNKNLNSAYYIGIGVNLAYTIIEFVYGTLNNSLVLISDAGHNLSDVASLILSLIGMKLAQKAETVAYTYGYKKASLLASLINAILLVVVVIGILNQAIHKLSDITEVPGLLIVWVALIGVFINTVSAFLFFKHQKEDINVKGAFLHLLVDALVSVGVVISGLVIYYTGWNIIDPIISIVIAIVIIVSTRRLLIESLRLVMDAVPEDIDFEEIEELIEDIDGVEDVHHIHIWALSSTINALTAHISIDDDSIEDWIKIKKEIKHELLHHKISHVTLELEKEDEECEQKNCKE